MTAAREQDRETIRFLNTYYDRMQREARDADALLDRLSKMEGRNAPLSDFLRAAVDGLR